MATVDGLITQLISPYGGSLIDLRVPAAEITELKTYASRLTSIQLSERAVCEGSLPLS